MGSTGLPEAPEDDSALSLWTKTFEQGTSSVSTFFPASSTSLSPLFSSFSSVESSSQLGISSQVEPSSSGFSSQTSSPLLESSSSTLPVSSSSSEPETSSSSISSFLNGTLDVFTTIAPMGDEYYVLEGVDANVIWVEDVLGNFVRTLQVWSLWEIRTLETWMAVRPRGPIDGISSATEAPGDRNTSWDMLDYNGQPVSPGDFVLWLENSEEKDIFVTYSLPFTLDGSTYTLADSTDQVFNPVHLNYTPLP